MVPPREAIEHALAEPFQPFLIHMASGRAFEIRHPEMAKVGKTTMIVYATPEHDPDGPERWEKLSYMLIESISPLPASAQPSKS